MNSEQRCAKLDACIAAASEILRIFTDMETRLIILSEGNK